MSTRLSAFMIVLALLIVGLSQSLFIVDEREQAIVLHLGEPVGEALRGARKSRSETYRKPQAVFGRMRRCPEGRHSNPFLPEAFSWIE